MVASCDVSALNVHDLLRWCGFLVRLVNSTDEEELLSHCLQQLAEASELLPYMLDEANDNLRLRIGATELARAAYEVLTREMPKEAKFTLTQEQKQALDRLLGND